MSLPVHQVRKGQPRPAEVLIHPDTDVMPGDLCRQPGPKPAELMGPLPVQAEGMKERVLDRCDALTDPREPAPQGLWPWGLPMPLGRTEDLGSRGLPPGGLMRLALQARIDDIRAQSRAPHTGYPRVGVAAQGTE